MGVKLVHSLISRSKWIYSSVSSSHSSWTVLPSALSSHVHILICTHTSIHRQSGTCPNLLDYRHAYNVASTYVKRSTLFGWVMAECERRFRPNVHHTTQTTTLVSHYAWICGLPYYPNTMATHSHIKVTNVLVHRGTWYFIWQSRRMKTIHQGRWGLYAVVKTLQNNKNHTNIETLGSGESWQTDWFEWASLIRFLPHRSCVECMKCAMNEQCSMALDIYMKIWDMKFCPTCMVA